MGVESNALVDAKRFGGCGRYSTMDLVRNLLIVARLVVAALFVVLAPVCIASCGSPAQEVADADAVAESPETTEVESEFVPAAGADSVDEERIEVADGESASTTTTTVTTTTSATSTTTTVAASSGDPELDVLIDELMVFLEAERGLVFLERPRVELLDGDEFSQAWLDLITEDVAENGESYSNFTDIYQTMGIISDDVSLAEIWQMFGEAGVLGYYDADAELITLRSGEINALTRTTLVHELVHALEDQHFDLGREEYDDRDDEISWAFTSIVEGSARVIENRYRDTFTDEEIQEENEARFALPRSVSFNEFTPSFLELQFGVYRYGETFADALWAQGQSAVDAALTLPPVTSELIFEPASFLSGAAADSSLRAPPADGAIFEQGAWGQAAWVGLLSDVMPVNDASAATNGWGGDYFVAWRNGAETCVRVDVSADSEAELASYADAISRWAQLQAGRTVESPSDGVVRLTACE